MSTKLIELADRCALCLIAGVGFGALIAAAYWTGRLILARIGSGW